MKPRKPLPRSTKPLKRTALQRSNIPLKRTPAPKQRKRIRPRSEKRSSEMDQRAEVVAIVHARDVACQAFLEGDASRHGGRLDVHEILPRGRGGDWLDVENCVLVCRWHHDWIHTHPTEATKRGLLRSAHP